MLTILINLLLLANKPVHPKAVVIVEDNTLVVGVAEPVLLKQM